MYAQLQMAKMLWDMGVMRARALRASEDRDLGASALEWAVISAILVTAAVLIGGIVYRVVSEKGDEINNCDVTVVPDGTC
jgi:hypothetical protein